MTRQTDRTALHPVLSPKTEGDQTDRQTALFYIRYYHQKQRVIRQTDRQHCFTSGIITKNRGRPDRQAALFYIRYYHQKQRVTRQTDSTVLHPVLSPKTEGDQIDRQHCFTSGIITKNRERPDRHTALFYIQHYHQKQRVTRQTALFYIRYCHQKHRVTRLTSSLCQSYVFHEVKLAQKKM